MCHTDRAVPQLCPVRQVQVISLATLVRVSLSSILFGADLIEHTIGVGHASEVDPHGAKCEPLFDDLVSLSNPKEQPRASSRKLGSR